MEIIKEVNLMFMAIGLISFVVFGVFIILALWNALKKTGKAKKNLMYAGIGMVVLIVALSLDSSPKDSTVEAAPEPIESASEVKAKAAETPIPTTSPKPTDAPTQSPEPTAVPTQSPEPTATPVAETSSQRNAVRAAKGYLDYAAFSRQGLIKQLEFEKYSNADAKYAVDQTGADWNEQAAKTAISYLDYSAFSKQELIKQLEFDGYTSEQAISGVDKSYK